MVKVEKGPLRNYVPINDDYISAWVFILLTWNQNKTNYQLIFCYFQEWTQQAGLFKYFVLHHRIKALNKLHGYFTRKEHKLNFWYVTQKYNCGLCCSNIFLVDFLFKLKFSLKIFYFYTGSWLQIQSKNLPQNVYCPSVSRTRHNFCTSLISATSISEPLLLILLTSLLHFTKVWSSRRIGH